MPDITISTEAVSEAASGVTQVADAVSAMNIQDPLTNAGGAAAGSHTAEIALDLAQKLIGDVQAMAEEIRNFGNSLHKASTNYENAELNSAPQMLGGR